MRLLVVTAVDAELSAVLGSAPAATVDVPGATLRRTERPAGTVDGLAAGVGASAAAAGTASALTAAACAGTPYTLVLSTGLAGGFADAVPVGGLLLADRVVAADLGVRTDDGFTDLAAMGFGVVTRDCDPPAVAELARRAAAAGHPPVVGPLVTVHTVTGTDARAAELRATHGAVGEAMEGFAVAEAAARHGVAFAELRAVSNAVARRDLSTWRIDDALAVLSTVMDSVLGEEWP